MAGTVKRRRLRPEVLSAALMARWDRYAYCWRCHAPAGQPCLNLHRTAARVYESGAHPGRTLMRKETR